MKRRHNRTCRPTTRKSRCQACGAIPDARGTILCRSCGRETCHACQRDPDYATDTGASATCKLCDPGPLLPPYGADCACCALGRIVTHAIVEVAIEPGEYQSGPGDRTAWLCGDCAAQHRPPMPRDVGPEYEDRHDWRDAADAREERLEAIERRERGER